jgi:hypothetical protein
MLGWISVVLGDAILSPYQIFLLARQVNFYRYRLLRIYARVSEGINAGAITTTEQIDKCFLSTQTAQRKHLK